MTPRNVLRLLPLLILLFSGCGTAEGSASFSDEERAEVEERGGKIAELRLDKVP